MCGLFRLCARHGALRNQPGCGGHAGDLEDTPGKARLLAGEYHPQSVRVVEISKPKGGTRQLGIPSVVDRLIQQELLQQLSMRSAKSSIEAFLNPNANYFSRAGHFPGTYSRSLRFGYSLPHRHMG